MFAQRRTRSGREYGGIHFRRQTTQRRAAQAIVENILQDFINDAPVENENNNRNNDENENDNAFEFELNDNRNDDDQPNQPDIQRPNPPVRVPHENHPHAHPGHYTDGDEYHRHRMRDTAVRRVYVPGHYRREPLF
jgi:hypothetical protein